MRDPITVKKVLDLIQRHLPDHAACSIEITPSYFSPEPLSRNPTFHRSIPHQGSIEIHYRFYDRAPEEISFGGRLMRLRRNAEMTQNELSVRSGLSAGLISHYEADRRKPSLDNLRSLVRGLGCSADELLGT